jgi:RHS repeat-associated protein
MPATHSNIRTIVTIFSFLMVVFSAQAQITNVKDDTSTPTPGVGHDYIHLLSETVNPANGSVSLRIQVPVAKGRGITIPFSIAYDSNGVHHIAAGTNPGYSTWLSSSGYLSQGGWKYSVPMVSLSAYNVQAGTYPNYYQCQTYSNYMFVDPSGGQHALVIGTQYSQDAGQCPGPGGPASTGGDPQVQASLPLTYPDPHYNPTATAAWPITVLTNDGTDYNFPEPSHLLGGSTQTYGLPAYIEDRNGNKVTTTDNNNGNFVFMDTAGRQAISSSGFGPSGTTNTVSVSGLTYNVTWKTTTASFSVPSTRVDNDGVSTCLPVASASDSQVVVSQITLPNGQAYKFYYGTDNPNSGFTNPYGLLSEIDYPDGGWVRYTWKLSDSYNELAIYPGQNDSAPYHEGCLYQYETPVVASRTVGYVPGTTPSLTQTFVYSTTWDSAGTAWTGKSTKVTSTDNVVAKAALTTHTYTSGYASVPPFTLTHYPGQIPQEQSTIYYNWSNTTTPLRTVNKSWYDLYDLSSQQTVLDNNQSSKTNYTYDPHSVLTRLTEKDEYDFGATGVTRKTVLTYQSFSGTPGIIADATCSSVTSDGSGNRVAESDYYYDGGTSLCGAAGTPSVTSVSNLPPNSHDETDFGPSSGISRGNATKASSLCFQSGVTCPSGNATTTYTYDETGQVLTKLDACGNTTCSDMTGSAHTTMYSYSDNYDSPPSFNTNTYLTKITNPLTQSVSFKYAYSDGQLIQSVDVNSQATSYVYGSKPTGCSFQDELRRLTEVDFPDGGKTYNCYNDTPYNSSTPSPSVTTTKPMGSPNNYTLTTLTAFDGIGHTVRSVLTDPDCGTGDRIDTTYDGFGHVHTSSNPYCVAGEGTSGLTTYGYDGIGRTIQVTHPDNTTVLTSYTGRATEVQDEGNGNGTQRVTRISQSDGLGRLTALCEISSVTLTVGQNPAPANCALDIGGTGFLTSYQYDTLDDLTQVTQGTISPRTFAYDSLSRLSSASNPESGKIAYTYDANGNLSTKTAPAPNQTGITTVATTSQYDSLNRILSKTYSDGTTPTVNYVYDLSLVDDFSPANPIGRQVERSTTSCTSTLSSYDVMGRITEEVQTIPLTCVSSEPWYSLVYTYDLLGDMTSSSTGLFVTYTYGYNSAARLTSVASSRTGTNFPPTLLSNAKHSAFGSVTSDTLGNGETETFGYDKRLRLQSSNAVLSSTPIYSFSLGFAPDSNVITANDSVNLNWVYNYDAFNRLTCSNLGTNGTCAAPTNGTPTYTYTYDRFGNRWNQTGPNTFNATFTGNDPGSPQNNNRMDGYSYDAAGNLLSDKTYNYTYDAENRISTVTGNGTNSAYVYDANGLRVEKTGNVAESCSVNGTGYYLHDLQGRTIPYPTSIGVDQCRDEVYAGNRHLVTYWGDTFFIHSDWVGTERAKRSVADNATQLCTSLPFGDALSCTALGAIDIPGPTHFTGKERDTESGLDNFGARYNASTMGRFMTPDPIHIMKQKLLDPQQWNMYSYVRNNPLRFTDPTGKYLVNCGAGDKKCNKAADKFEKQREKDLNSKDQKVRDAAGAWGNRGTDNHINVTFKPQAQVDADANTRPGYRTDAIVSASPGADHKGSIEAEFSESLGGSSLGQTISHEGSHIEDDFNFLKSYDSSTGKYNGDLNFTHFDTEFQAFEAGSGVKSYSEFQRGPKGYQQLEDYIYRAYPNANDLVFPPSTEFPQ